MQQHGQACSEPVKAPQRTRYRCGWEGQADSRASRIVTMSSRRLSARLVPKVQVQSRKARKAHSALCRKLARGRGSV